MTKHQISTGKVLLAEPFMQDPNFKRAAILLTDYSEEGSVGFILNKQLDMNIDAMLYFSKEATLFIPFGNSTKLKAYTYKVMLDGSVGSQTACFKKPYRGTNNYGKLLMTRIE